MPIMFNHLKVKKVEEDGDRLRIFCDHEHSVAWKTGWTITRAASGEFGGLLNRGHVLPELNRVILETCTDTNSLWIAKFADYGRSGLFRGAVLTLQQSLIPDIEKAKTLEQLNRIPQFDFEEAKAYITQYKKLEKEQENYRKRYQELGGRLDG